MENHLIERIDSVQLSEDGVLYVYFTRRVARYSLDSSSSGLCFIFGALFRHSGEPAGAKASICREKLNNMLLDFYESNLRWSAGAGQNSANC
ncbi:hypothetical protein B0H13DRAFT_2305477 [Mycena leptocephala]|nr:hypothetical protein B0H13DRAFT_2305477 [Mycena leptocephala]